jgi:hypothetical protein
VTFAELRTRATWQPIPNCPGRFTLAAGPSDLAPQELAGPTVVFQEFHVTAARDTVIVGRLEDGGIITYRRVNGSYVHTLNTADGFARKLQQLGIS